MQGCVYISGLSMDNTCVRALMKYARVLLISTTASSGPTICPGFERAGCPCGVITDAPCCTPWCESLYDAARISARRSIRSFLHLDGWSIYIIMGQQGPDHSGIFVGYGHRGHIGAFAAFEGPHPPRPHIGFVRRALHHRPRAMNQEGAHVAIASFREPPKRAWPPLENCRGTSPSHAARCRPF